jgi:predicted secreted protein
MRSTLIAVLFTVVCLPLTSIAQGTAPSSSPTLRLEASARAQVNNDEMVVTLAAERDGTDIGALNQAVLQALNTALEEARKASRVQARMGNVFTNQNFNAQGRPSGWKVRGEVTLTSQNLPELGRLAGELSQRLQLAGVGFRLADETRSAAEKRLINEAATAFRNKARDASAALGFSGYAFKDVVLNTSGRGGPRPEPMMRAMAADTMRAAAPVPTESGESEVVVSFSGSIDLK